MTKMKKLRLQAAMFVARRILGVPLEIHQEYFRDDYTTTWADHRRKLELRAMKAA